MKLTNLIVSIILLLSSQILMAQTEPTIATCDGEQDVCLTGTVFELCVKITVKEGLEAPIDHFIIDWDDGSTTRIEASDNPADQFHNYDFDGFYNTCSALTKKKVFLETYLTNGEVKNNGFTLTIRNPPIAQFAFNRNTLCAGDEVILNNNSCPTEGLELVSWEYGDGTSGMEDRHTYTEAGDYPVTLSVVNKCGVEAKVTQTLEVIDPPQAIAEPIEGVIQGTSSNEPYLVCLGGGGEVILDGSASQNATEFEWSPRSGRGIQWVSDQKNKIDTLRFLEAGNYDITLTVNNACNKQSICVHQFRVVEAATLQLEEQPDACNNLSYTPNPFNPDATYSINGDVVTEFPQMLSAGTYIIAASLTNECGPQMEPDTFIVATEQNINILNKDTTLCSSDLPLTIQLSNDSDNGSCLVNGNPLVDCTFNPANFAGQENTITYDGECLTSNEVTIEVIATENLKIELPKNTFCIEDLPFEIQVSDPGGQISGKGFIDSSFIYDPSLAGIGKDTIRYELEFEASGSEVCPASAIESIEIFPALNADFITTDCNGNTVSFDTLNVLGMFTTILYDFGDGRTSTEITPTHTYNTPGSYIVTMTIAQAGGCEFSVSEEITVEPPPVANFVTNSEPRGCSILEVQINDQSSGNNRKYFWDFGNGQTDSTANPSNVFYEAIGQDTTYLITLSVSNGCSTKTTTRTINVKAGPNPFFDLDKNLHCSGEEVAFQSVTANLSNSNNDFWRWDFGNGQIFEEKDAPPQTYITTIQDTFLVSLTVGNNCDTTTHEVPVVVIPSDVTAFLNIDKTIGCADSDFRFINNSGVPNAEFFFSNGTSQLGDTIETSFSTLVDSTFSVTMRVFGCGYDDTTMSFRVLPLPELELFAPEEICAKENFEITTIANVAGIELLLGNGDSLAQNVATYAYDSSGNYTITARATSSLGCSLERATNILVKETPIAAFNIGAMPFCAENTISIQDTSIGNIMDWQWKLGDGNSRTASPTIDYTFSTAGNYEVQLIVENDLFCKDSTTQNIEVQPLPVLEVDYEVLDACDTYVRFSNSTEADHFEWFLGHNDATSNDTQPEYRYPSAGSYMTRLLATLNGCSDSTELEVLLEPIPNLSLMYEQDQNCPPSKVRFDASASGEVDSLLWSFGENTISFDAIQTHTYTRPGEYEVILSLSKGNCKIDSTFIIEIGDTLLANVVEQTDVACFGEATGSASITVSSGNAPYSFSWSNGSNTNPTTALSAGSYQVTITDQLACSIVLETSILEPDNILTLNLLRLEGISCYEETDGALEIAGLGGTPPYQYEWTDGSTTRNRDQLAAGDYIVTITDGNNCKIEESIELTQPDPLQINFSTQAVCYGTLGDFTVNVLGGTPPFLISRFSNFEELGDFYENLPAGVYSAFVEDSRGCLDSANVEIEERPDWQFFFEPSQYELLKGDSIRLQASLSISKADLIWFPNESISFIDERTVWARPFKSTDYEVWATDEFGCVKTTNVAIEIKDTVAVYIPNAFTPGNKISTGNGINDYFTAYSHFPAVQRIQQMVIANKWGQILFDKTNLPLNVEEAGWDGRFQDEPQPPDDYAYRIVIEYVDGKKETFKGIVRLIR